jgi:hypothetical protein
MICKKALLVGLLYIPSGLADAILPDQPQVINTDVAIIGGGAAGIYAAVRLREDFQTSVVVTEPRDHLGGHVSTYVVPETNTTLEYGVQSYIRNDAAIDFFSRFGIATQTFTSKRNTAINVDVETGAQLKNYTAPSLNATNETFQRWLTIVAKYEKIMEPGYWGFPQPDDIPEELLMPIENFVKLHQLEAIVPRIITISGLGYGGIRHLLTFNLIRAFGASLSKQVVENSLVAPIGSNSLLYQRALALLKDDVLLSSSVTSAQRTPEGVHLRVQQGDKEYQINAKCILYTAPPSLSALAPYDLDDTEGAVFAQFVDEAEFIGVAKIPCLAENTSVNYIPAAAAPANQLYLKDYPYSLRLDSTGPSGLGLFRVVFGANYTLSADAVKETVYATVQRLQNAGTVKGECEVEFKALSDHTRPQWYLKAEQLRAGFVQELYALQGRRSTWWTGGTWAAPYSSTVWAFTDGVVGRVVEDLRNS